MEKRDTEQINGITPRPDAAGRVSVISMSKGAGIVERRIADLLAATRDRALSIDEIVDNAYALSGAKPTRAQRLSATRAAHRLLHRVRETYASARQLIQKAHTATEAALGREEMSGVYDKEYNDRFKKDPAYIESNKLYDWAKKIGTFSRIVKGDRPGFLKVETDHWIAETVNRRLYFHPPDVPARVWAVSMSQGGITWAEAEVIKVTARNVMVRYAGEAARLDRKSLWHWWALWRGVLFVSSRTGRIANELDELWWKRYGASGGVPPSMQMPLADAMALLGVPADYTREDVIGGFRRAAKKAHPDAGGTAEMFRKLVEARDRLLAALGTSAPPPKPPSYAPKGAHLIYRTGSGSSRARLGNASLRRLA